MKALHFGNGISKHRSNVLKSIPNFAQSNPFSIYYNNDLEVSSMYDVDTTSE